MYQLQKLLTCLIEKRKKRNGIAYVLSFKRKLFTVKLPTFSTKAQLYKVKSIIINKLNFNIKHKWKYHLQ